MSLFGTSWIMPGDMTLSCQYTANVEMRVSLKPEETGRTKNYVFFEFSRSIQDLLWQNDKDPLFTPDDQEKARKYFDKVFEEDFQVLYIPAGREMITLFSDQLSYIFSGMDPIMQRNIDYCTKMYVNQILKLKPLFTRGTQGLYEDQLHQTSEPVDRELLNLLQNLMDRILQGKYVYEYGEERFKIDEQRYLKINYTSSGQQEIVCVLNILFYYALNRKKTFMILEEPESHLYPESQNYVVRALALFYRLKNKLLVTTHSPYILGAFNNSIFASELPHSEKRDHIINPAFVIQQEDVMAGFVTGGHCEEGMEDGLIKNALIDGVSATINDIMYELTELSWEQKEKANAGS